MGGRNIARGALLLLLASCESAPAPDAGPGRDAGPDTDAGPPLAPVDFEADIEPLLVTHCSTCHEGRGSPGPMFLELGDYETSVLAHPDLVVPGDPDSSLMLTKGEHRGPMWEPAHAALIRRWILSL